MIKFKKMHGNGNDFIIIENLTTNQKLSRSQLIKMGDRHKGLGFDQLITINPPNNSNHDFYIRFFNSDGSEADMCMNGVRSVGAFLWKAELAPNKPLLLGTKSKPICIKPINSKHSLLMNQLPKTSVLVLKQTMICKMVQIMVLFRGNKLSKSTVF